MKLIALLSCSKLRAENEKAVGLPRLDAKVLSQQRSEGLSLVTQYARLRHIESTPCKTVFPRTGPDPHASFDLYQTKTYMDFFPSVVGRPTSKLVKAWFWVSSA
jgi:hypothetical protein